MVVINMTSVIIKSLRVMSRAIFLILLLVIELVIIFFIIIISVISRVKSIVVLINLIIRVLWLWQIHVFSLKLFDVIWFRRSLVLLNVALLNQSLNLLLLSLLGL